MKNTKSMLFRPFILEGWMSIISSILLSLYVLFIGIMVNSIKTFICLIPIAFIALLLFFYGLRNISKSRDDSYNYYINKVRIIYKTVLLVSIFLLGFITIRYVPEDNRTNENIIANAQVINFSAFKKEISDGDYYIVLINDNVKINCSKDLYNTIDTEKTDKYGYRIKYRWDFFFPHKYYLVDLKKINLESISKLAS